jgi:hypothetical protein
MTTSELRQAGLAAAILALLAGPAAALTNPEIPPPGSGDFDIGYVHGCKTGYADAGRYGFQTLSYRDERLYASSADYRAGWDQGRHACYEFEISRPHLGRPR